MTLLQSKLVHFLYLFFYSIAGLMGASSQYFEITGSGGARSLSIQDAFSRLQSKGSTDQIAADLLASSMPRKTFAQQEILINLYNERLRKQEEDNVIALANGVSPVKPGQKLSDKISTKAKFQQAVAAMAHQAALKQAEEERLALQAKAEEDRLAAEEQERKLQAELQAVKEKASLLSPMKAKLAEASTEIERLKSQGSGGGVGGVAGALSPVDLLINALAMGTEVTIKTMLFNDATHSIHVSASVNGHARVEDVPCKNEAEYNRVKILLAMFANMHSKAFNAASSAVGDLLTDILSSSAPQDYHLKQTAQLAATTSRLDEFLNYHIALQQKLTGWAALPLSDFLAIRFLSTDAVEFTRSQVLGEFKAIRDQIPLQDELPLGCQALDKFLKKIASSIELPTEIEFSTKEIEDIFKELGLLLETDSDGIVIDSEYYTQLLEFSQKFTALKKAMLSKDAALYKSDDVKAALNAIEQSILAANPALPADFEDICGQFNDLVNISIASKGLQKTLGELKAITDRSLNMPLQDDGLVTQVLKTEGTETASIQAVLFLLQKFAKTQFDNVIKNSIVGNLDPAIQAACATYYGRDLQTIKDALLNSAGFTFNEGNYKKLKGSENVTFIKLYLESITTGNPIVVNLDKLKESTLGIQSSIEAKRKTVLILRVSDLLYSSEFQTKLSVEEATAISERSADFCNPAIADAVLQYELQDNTLKTERDKKRFLDAYLRVSLAKPSSTSSSSSDPSEVSHEDKVRRLKDFFAQTLASTAKDVDLVKLVLTLPMLKKGYQASFDKFIEVINEFNSVYASGASSSSASDTRIRALRKAFADIDSVCTEDEKPTLKRTLDKLLQLQEISQKFLTVGNSTGAMVGAGDSLLQDSSFPVTAGISQLEFDTVLKNTDYNVFYNAVKILNLIALAMPSADDFSLIEKLMLAKIPSEESEKKEQLKQLLTDVINMANKMRQQSTEFYGQITTLMQFVDNFEQQKNKYDESSGEECINFHERLDALSGTKPKPAVLAIAVTEASALVPVDGGVVEEQPKVERYYTEEEIETLGACKAAYKKQLENGLTPDAIRTKIKNIMQINIDPKYTGSSVVTVAASAPNLPVDGGVVEEQPKVERYYTDAEIETLGACRAAYKKQLGAGLSPDAIRAKIKSIMQLEIEAKFEDSVVTVAASAPNLSVAGGFLAGIVGKGQKRNLEPPLDDDDTPTDNGMPKQHRVEEQPKVERYYTEAELKPIQMMARKMYNNLKAEEKTPEAIRLAIKEAYPSVDIAPKYNDNNANSASIPNVVASDVASLFVPKLPTAGGLSALFGAKPPVAGEFLAEIVGKGQKRNLEVRLVDDDTPTDNGMPKQHRVEEQPKVERYYTDAELKPIQMMARKMYNNLKAEEKTPEAIRLAIKEAYPSVDIAPKYNDNNANSASIPNVVASDVASLFVPKLPTAGGLSALFGAKPPVAGEFLAEIVGKGQKRNLEPPLDDDDTADDDTPTDNGMPKQHRVEEQQVERVYDDLELLKISDVMARGMYKRLRNEGKTAAAIRAALTTKYPDIQIEPKYTGANAVTVAASAPNLPVAGGLSALFGAKPPVAGGGMLAALGANQPKFIYAKLSPMGSLVTWLNKTEQKLKDEMAAALGETRSSNMSNTSVLIKAFYKPLMEQQIAYLQQIDYSKLEKEEDAFYLVRQVLTTADLYLRIQRHEKMLREATTAALKKELQSFENRYFSQKDYTISEIIKAFKTPAALNAHKTNELLMRIKTGGSDLKRLIGNTIIETFEAGSINIINPVIAAIDSYA